MPPGKLFPLRLSDEDRRALEQKAAEANMTLTDFIRTSCGLSKAQSGRPKKDKQRKEPPSKKESGKKAL